ncbi:MAG: hypothetical protein AAGB29_07400 [Planctomycetota bacterium]
MSGDATLRGAMARDLISSGELTGISQERVIGLLGPPDVTNQLRDVYVVELSYDFMGQPWVGSLEVEYDPEAMNVMHVYLNE